MEPQHAFIIFLLGYRMLLQNSCAVPAPAGGSLELQEARSSLHKKQQRWTKQVAGVGDVHFAGHAPVSRS